MIATPRQQYNHQYVNKAVNQWLDIHFGDHSFDGRVFIGHRKRGGGIYTMTARSLSELKQYVGLVHVSQRLDYYITANTVSGTSRTMGGLFGLQNIVIDLDCHDKSANVPELVQAFIWRAERDLWSGDDFPRPNSILKTGRGVQLWWAIKPCHASCRYHYDKIKAGMMDHLEVLLSEYSELDGLEIDRAASSNPVGYFRFPCTYNTVAKRYGALQVLHTERYDTHELARYISPFLTHKRAVQQTQAVAMEKCDLDVLNKYYGMGAKRVTQLVKLRNLRNNDVGSETRNNLCFSVYNALRMSYDHEEAMRRVRAYNSGFKQPMTDVELEHTVCSAMRKNGYRYSNSKLIELLSITEAEQDTIGLHPFTGQYRPYNHARPNATRDMVRKARKDGRDCKIVDLHTAGVSQAEIARRLEISRNTVARVLRTAKDMLNNGSIYDCLLCPPVSAQETDLVVTATIGDVVQIKRKPYLPPPG